MKKIKLLLLIIIPAMIFSACGKPAHEPSVSEFMSNPARQDSVISYIVNDYALTQKFIDHCLVNDKAKSMLIGHRGMMTAMMQNPGMMTEILRCDSTGSCVRIFPEMMNSFCNDSLVCSRMADMMLQNTQMQQQLKARKGNGNR